MADTVGVVGFVSLAFGMLLVACSGASSDTITGAPAADGGPPTSDGAVSPDPAHNSPLCPASKPDGGSGCPSVGLVCSYASGCAVPSKATCSQAGTWGVSIPDCATQCPNALPTSSSTCQAPSLECDYGDDPRPWCRDRASCLTRQTKDATWSIGKAATLIGPTSCSTPAQCPATAPKTDDKCTATTWCTFGGDSCVCYDRLAGCGACESADYRWTCAPLPPAPCPSSVPNLGSACPSDGVACRYGACGSPFGALSFSCTGGAWKSGAACK